MNKAMIRGFQCGPYRHGRCCAGLALLAVMVASCAGRAPMDGASEQLQERTGSTLTRVAEPLVLYHDDPTLAVNARDYIFMAPLAVNRGGALANWLWLGAWSTIDRGVRVRDSGPGEFSGVQLIVDGEPMELDLGAGLAQVPGVDGLPYVAPVVTARNLFLPLTGSQVARLGGAGMVALRIEYAGGDARIWERWGGNASSLRAFAELTGANSGNSPVTTAAHEP